MAKDDINKEIKAAKETVEEKRAQVVLEEKLLEIRKKLNSEEKTAVEYAEDQAAIELKKLRAVEDELAAQILLNQEKIEGGQLDADGLKIAKDAIAAAEIKLIKATAAADAQERGNRAAAASIKHADNLFKRMTPFLSDVPETAAGALFLNPGKFTGQFAGKMKDLVNPTKITIGLVDTMAQATMALATQQDEAIATFRQATGAGDQFDQTIVDLERDLVTAGVTSAEAGQAVQSLFLNVTDFTEMSGTQQEELAKTVSLLNELGVSTDVVSKNMQFAIKTLGMGTKQAGALQRELATFAKDLGVSSQKMADDFASMGPQIAALGDKGVGAFRKLQVQAKSTGLALSEILGIVEKFDKFDSAAQSVGKLNALLGGPYLNTLELVAETDPSKRFQILKDSIDDAGLSFDQMDYYQKKAIASAMGLNEQQLALMMRGRLDLVSEPAKSAAEIEELVERQMEFATMTQELAQTFMSLAVSMRPAVNLFKDLLNFIQWAAPALQIGIGLWAGWRMGVTAAATVQKIMNLLSFEFTLGEYERSTALAVSTAATNTSSTAATRAGVSFRFMGVNATYSLGAIGMLIAAVGMLAYMFFTSAGSPGFITIIGLVALAFLGMGIAANAFGWSISAVLPFILGFAAAIMMMGLGIGIAAAGMGFLINSLVNLGTALAGSMMLTAVAIAQIVDAIDEIPLAKTIALTAAIVPLAAMAPVAMMAGAAAGAMSRGLGGGESESAEAMRDGSGPTINIKLNVDGTEFATAVNNVEVEKYTGGRSSEMYKSVVDLVAQGFNKSASGA